MEIILAIYCIFNGIAWTCYNTTKDKFFRIFSQIIFGILSIVCAVLYLYMRFLWEL